MAADTTPAAKPATAPASIAPRRAFRCDGTPFGSLSEIKIEAVDFRNPTFLADGELRRLKAIHLDYLRSMASRLSGLLRSEVVMTLAKFNTQSCEAFIEGLKNPTQISLFRVHPLTGVGLVEIPPRLAAALTNRILGGRESTSEQEVILTEIEVALLEDVINIITSEWCEQWKEQIAMAAHLLGHESNPRFVQALPKNAVMLVVGIEAACGKCEETIQIAVPLSMIEPMMKRMHATRARASAPQFAEGSVGWRTSYDGIAIPVHAEMTAANLTVGALLKLRVGDVLELPTSALEQTRLTVAGAPRFAVHAGQQNGRIAVQITEKLSRQPQ